MKHDPKKDLKRLILILTIFAIFSGFIILDRLSNKPAIRNYCQVTARYASAHQRSIESIMSSLFKAASQCNNGKECLPQLKDQIVQELGDEYFKLDYSQSTYFVRTDDHGLIEKMFLGGDYQAKTPETWREKFFLWHLNHQLKICDYFWKNDISTTSMTYLRDFISEAEILVPTGTYNGYHTGIVKVWGD